MNTCTLEDIEKKYLSYNLNSYETFSKQVIDEVKNLNTDITDEDYKKYEDHTKEQIVTIDGRFTQDMDDAILVKKIGKLYSLTVYIADVSHYVVEGSKLDEEALARGTSIYLPNKTLNMLPPKLSNDICSLKESKKRLTLAVNMIFNKKGKLKESRIFKAIITSKKKMTYDKVYEVIERSNKDTLNEYNEFISQLNLMKELALILRKKRAKKGFIELSIPEYDFYVPSSFEFEHINLSVSKRNIANIIIEEFMLATNMTVDKTLCNLGIPFIHRIHPFPSLERLELELNINKDKLCKDKSYLVKLISKTLKNAGNNKRILLSYNIRSCLSCAKYSEVSSNHFALNAKNYCHFTSPIRRYPDLMIHRIISEYIDNGCVTDDIISKYETIVKDIAKKCSEAEAFAKKVSREIENMYIAYYMQDFIGEEFNASIYNLSKHSIKIFVKNVMITGKIKCSSILKNPSIEPICCNDNIIFDKNTTLEKYQSLVVKLVDIEKRSYDLIFEVV